ncbi:MAG TPA: TIGR03668 family PPOX class F420-dependent oxidoreductase [Acidimicrobiia bacterium]|nr:TIGR03668 family PPOX class F420-dependent oxidoreductase [Acidimicrobiia bacterium]
MDEAEARTRLEAARVGHLATVRPDGGPHVVPVTFAVVGNVVLTMVDHKPKTTTRLQRLANIETYPSASLLIDHWSEDWTRLLWVRVDGAASIHADDPVWSDGRAALAVKYHQYGGRPPEGPAIAISIDRISGWSSRG